MKEPIQGSGRQTRLYVDLAGNVFWNGISQAVPKVATLATNVYLARVLGVEAFGVLVLSQTVAMYAWLAADLGISGYGVREVARASPKISGVFRSLWGLRLCSTLCAFSLYAVGVIGLGSTANLPPGVLLACGVYILAYSLSPEWVLRGIEAFRNLAFASFVLAFFYLGSVLMLVGGPRHLLRAAVVWGGSYAVHSVVLWYCAHRLGVSWSAKFDIESWRLHLRESTYFAAAGILSSTYAYLPIFLAGKGLETVELGLFVAPLSLITSLSAPGYYVSSAFYPRLSILYHSRREEYHRVTRVLRWILIGFGCTLLFVSIQFGESLFLILMGEQYEPSARLVPILGILFPTMLLRYGLTGPLQAADRQHLQLPAFGAGLVILLGGYAVLSAIVGVSIVPLAYVVVIADLALDLGLFLVSYVHLVERKGSDLAGNRL